LKDAFLIIFKSQSFEDDINMAKTISLPSIDTSFTSHKFK